jgi:hypothetical protein
MQVTSLQVTSSTNQVMRFADTVLAEGLTCRR